MKTNARFRSIPIVSFSCAMLVAILILPAGTLRAHEHIHTHASLSVGSLLFLDEAFPEDGALFPLGAREQIRNGSINEDNPPNYVNHFYDPHTGLNTTPSLGNPQTTAPRRAALFWEMAVTDFRAGDTNRAFEKLGHVCHLLQDMTSPAHVHNDVHAEIPVPWDINKCQDGDDFENWGWSDCQYHLFSNILMYVTSTNVATATLRTNLSDGLKSIFDNQPQRVSYGGVSNIAYSYVHELATNVYTFTTFAVRLRDTFNSNDKGEKEFAQMFPSLEETTVPPAWWVTNIGYSQGECVVDPNEVPVIESWWIMPSCNQRYESFGTVYVVDGDAYIENTGGGSGAGFLIPDNLYPRAYNRSWYSKRYKRNMNATNDTVSMLRIYGDVLYPAAIAYGAGLLQAFLDEAVMPRPITAEPIMTDGSSGSLIGQANAGGANAIAWFEWHLDGGSTNRTSPQSIGNGTGWVGLSSGIQGLNPDTTYYCRLVSSNQFGVRYGTNRVFRTPAFILAANGMNAWQITDNSEASGSTLRYVTNLNIAQQGMATSNGWKLALSSRFVTDFGDTKAITVSYTERGQRFLFWLDLDPNGDLSAEFDVGIVRKLTTNAIGASDYHTHEVQYTNGKATYRFDGIVVLTNWTGTPTVAEFPTGQVSWGATSSGGRGQMNFNHVEFAIGGSNVVAAYNAGTAGNPAEAPAPITQGWTRLAGATPIPEGPLSPDGEAFLVEAETLAASGLGLQGAQLNGRADPRGATAVVWFEWGTNSVYGNVTTPQTLPVANGWMNVNAQLGELTQETTYHYRIVASNSFGIRFGADHAFPTPSYLITGPLPNAWQITDNSGSAIGPSYKTNLNAAQQFAATNSGWRYVVTARMTANFAGSKTMNFYYDQGATRFLVWWTLTGGTNLTAELEGQTPRIMASFAAATNYHTHELVYDPASHRAAYWFDGNFVTNWAGAASTAGSGDVAWGCGSSAGMGQMNFHDVEFSVASLGVLADYNAGTAGNPANVPSPTAQGWTLTAPAGTTSHISPDPVPYLPIADAETLAAGAIGPNTAQLNASVNPRGESTEIWFEWGTTLAYGNRTSIQTSDGSGAIPFTQFISGLTSDATYHYRVVASNQFSVSFGSERIFQTGRFQDSGIALMAVDVGAVAWGDYDNDGFLDLVITGQTDSNQVTQLYRNLGGTNFLPVTSNLPAVNQSAVAWGDFDNDGYLDLAISGWRPSGALSRIYRNAHDGTFVDVNAGLPGLRTSSITWSDYDNDGDLDLLLTGYDDTNTTAIARLYRNDGGTNFVDIHAALPGVAQGAVAWADFDGDGDPDFVLTGRDNSQIQISRIYRNDGSGIFSDIGANLLGVEAGSVAWGDYDGDGDPDLLLTGWDGNNPVTQLYRNEHNGSQSTFTPVPTGLPSLSASSVAWGDFDNDGDLDIVMAGWSGTYSARILRNDGAESFVEIVADLTGVNWTSVAWADYDKDGDLDFLVTGSTESNRVCRLYRNGTPLPNTAPAPPSGLAGSGIGNTVTLTWNPATDDATRESQLSYNVVLRRSTNGLVLGSPMADLGSGFRRIVRDGNVGQSLASIFTGLSPGTYSFTVQAIDSTFAGGPFAPWQTVEIAPFPVAILTGDVPTPGQFRLRIIAGEGSSCEVLRSEDMETWNAIGLATEISAGVFEFVDPDAPAGGSFYRVRSNTSH